MIKVLFTLILLKGIIISAQEVNSPITISKNWLGQSIYKHNGEKLKINGIREIVISNDSALYEIRKAKKIVIPSRLLTLTGGILIGVFANGFINGDFENALPIGISCGLISVSFPLEKLISKHSRKSVEIYNRSLLK